MGRGREGGEGEEREGKGWRGRGRGGVGGGMGRDGEGGEFCPTPTCPPRPLCPSLLAWGRSTRMEKERGFGEEQSMEDLPFRMISPSSINACGTVAHCAFTFSCPLTLPPTSARDAGTEASLGA